MKKRIDPGYLISLLLSVVLAFVIGAVILAIAGFSPGKAYLAMLNGAFSSARHIGDLLEYAMVLCLCGLACVLGARVGIFNVGGEGQLLLGAIVACQVGVWLDGLTPWLVLPLAALAAMAAGGLYALIPGVLKVKVKVNEVITTIMLNTVAASFCQYLAKGPWKNANKNMVAATEQLNARYWFGGLIGGSNLSTAILAAAVLALVIWYVMQKTSRGYEMKLTGQNERFARFIGIRTSRLVLVCMLLSGALCGLVGMFRVYGAEHLFRDSISRDYYFEGLMVAMIARYQPLAVVFLSLFFAALKIGAQGMELAAVCRTRSISSSKRSSSSSWLQRAACSARCRTASERVRRRKSMLESILKSIFSAGTFQQMLRSATPVALAALGGSLTEHAGIMNIGMDGMILMGAFFGVLGSWLFASAAAGVALAVGVGLLVGLFFALFVVKLRSDEFIIGCALNTFALGLTGFLSRSIFGASGTKGNPFLPSLRLPGIESIPFLGRILSGNSLFVYLTLLFVLLLWLFLYKTPYGFWLRASGEKPETLRTAGIDPAKLKWLASILCGVFCALAGAHLSLGQLQGTFAENMSNNRGYIAFACVIFGRGQPTEGLSRRADVRLL